MKLMKRILAIVCTFVMIISMATGVNAVDEPSTSPTKGSITVENVKAGETYKVYKILTLDSYDKDKEAYSYIRNAEPDKWNTFVGTNQAREFLDENADGYVTFKPSATSDKSVRKFALTALKYAKENKISATKEIKATAETTEGNTIKFTDLPLGYYLVESTVGTACSLTTTNPNATVQDKHDVPEVSKKIISGGKIYQDGAKNTVDFGTVVKFETKVTLKPYTQNYVLHDKMDSGFDTSSVSITNVEVVRRNSSKEKLNEKYYSVDKNPADHDTFDIKFTKEFYQDFSNAIDSEEVTHIVVTYTARVSNNAPVSTPILNKTHLSYGQNSKTDESQTKTYTWAIPVFKFTGTDTPLANAKFILSTEIDPTLKNAIKFSSNNEGEYKFDENGTAELTSPKSGIIKINGIKDGTYYLKEIEAPNGYNLLKTPIRIVVTPEGAIKVDDNPVERVDVKNNSGSLLPSTGGMGTTLIYVVGSILVLASAIVLFSKKKEGSN